MSDELFVQLSLHETCMAVGLSTDLVVEIVDHGIVEPEGSAPSDWRFDVAMITTAQRASRLHRDLEIDWTAVAVILDLVEERDRLKRENKLLNQRLSRFLLD